MSCCGDLLAQFFWGDKKQSFDFERTFKFAAVGGLFIGPSYGIVSKLMEKWQTANFVMKFAIEGFVVVPIVLTAAVGLIGKIQNFEWNEIKNKIFSEAPTIVLISCLVSTHLKAESSFNLTKNFLFALDKHRGYQFFYINGSDSARLHNLYDDFRIVIFHIFWRHIFSLK